jgi:hypothetical protein
MRPRVVTPAQHRCLKRLEHGVALAKGELSGEDYRRFVEMLGEMIATELGRLNLAAAQPDPLTEVLRQR